MYQNKMSNQVLSRDLNLVPSAIWGSTLTTYINRLICKISPKTPQHYLVAIIYEG